MLQHSVEDLRLLAEVALPLYVSVRDGDAAAAEASAATAPCLHNAGRRDRGPGTQQLSYECTGSALGRRSARHRAPREERPAEKTQCIDTPG